MQCGPRAHHRVRRPRPDGRALDRERRLRDLRRPPPGYSGEVGPTALEAAVSKLSVITRTAALVLPITGVYQVLQVYPGDALLQPPRGHLVLGMILLWAVVTALVEIAGSRMRDGLAEDKVRTPARAGRPFMLAASVLSVVLLVDAGLLASGFGA